MRPGAAARERKKMKMTAGVELVREEGGGEGSASLRDGRREDDEGVQDLLSAEPGVAGAGRSGGGGGCLRVSSVCSRHKFRRTFLLHNR